MRFAWICLALCASVAWGQSVGDLRDIVETMNGDCTVQSVTPYNVKCNGDTVGKLDTEYDWGKVKTWVYAAFVFRCSSLGVCDRCSSPGNCIR